MNLSYLFLLACPIGMGLMMWMMMRGNGQQNQSAAARAGNDVAGLHQQLQALERQQASIMAEIQRLREAERPVARDPDEQPAAPQVAENRLA